MPVCNHPDWSDCAHEASKKLLDLKFDIKGKGKVNCESCNLPIRAHDVGQWASTYPSVANCNNVSTYLVYQVRDIDSQGHVYVYSGGKCYGNGFYDWPEKN